jgi:hypothetical protein
MPMRSTVLLSLIALVLASGAFAQSSGRDDAAKVKRHFKIERPAHLSNQEALTIYENIGRDMAKGYGASHDPAASQFRKWRRYNSAPYRSATHGNRYVNNYANTKAAAYAKMKSGDKAPAGAVFAKDSFTVTSDGGVFGGALFMMEKLSAGKSPKTADWRYWMILPDGSIFGDSRGDNAAEMAFCHGCHQSMGKRRDFLFYVPKKYRRQFLGD